jgi:hypothetical protein
MTEQPCFLFFSSNFNVVKLLNTNLKTTPLIYIFTGKHLADDLH